ncbi:MAG TPA: class I SAM-dependent methyltransferase [Deltaproteobacteria bacterium]|nr:class I SAM-dependent methyltransferase [Deltaproteobacteria bacterium]HPP79507.1 class I SAM-dependent methyltransferase [Deltaproteobacteria bacterium]
MLTVDFSRIELKPGSRVLDAGCGAGRHLAEAFRARGVSVVGVDINKEDALKALNTTKIMRHAGEDGGGLALVTVSDVTRLPFKDASFDVVICSEVLEHIPEHTRAIEEIVRVLKPGKSLVVSVPRYLPERICWALSEEYHTEKGGHVRIYKTSELVALLERAGLKCIGRGWAHALHSPYWWIKCMVGHKNDQALPVRLYHKFLVWDIMKKPRLTRTLDRLLNPVIAKSVVLYCTKGDSHGT